MLSIKLQKLVFVPSYDLAKIEMNKLSPGTFSYLDALRRNNLPGFKGVHQSTDRDQGLKDWEEKKIKTLIVHRNMSTGWRTKLTRKEVIITFVGMGWSNNEKAQCMARLSLNLSEVPDVG
jgi:hypothetical protein